MTIPPTPANEAERLRRLRSLGILDTPPEERFDVVTRLAKQLFQVEMALVSLVDEDRQWFKSRMGLDATETPRDISFCGHAVCSGDTLVVPNALEDQRFHDNPLVTGAPNIRFYAGHPIAAQDAKVGTLCIIDNKPREFDELQVKMLADLGALVERELVAMELAALDEATGLVNRRGLHLTGRHMLSMSKRTGQPVSVLFFDLDGFKEINDSYGHEAGDQALEAFSRHLLNAFDASDIVARLGGDEFCILLAAAKPEDLAPSLARLDALLDEYNRELTADRHLRYSVGISCYNPSRHRSFTDLLAAADEAMYLQKADKKTELAQAT